MGFRNDVFVGVYGPQDYGSIQGPKMFVLCSLSILTPQWSWHFPMQLSSFLDGGV